VRLQITALWDEKKVELRETQRAVTPFGGAAEYLKEALALVPERHVVRVLRGPLSIQLSLHQHFLRRPQPTRMSAAPPQLQNLRHILVGELHFFGGSSAEEGEHMIEGFAFGSGNQRRVLRGTHGFRPAL